MHRMTPLGVGEGNPSFSSARGGEKQLFQQTFFFVQRWRTAPITSSFLLVPQRWRFDRRRKEKHFQHRTNMLFFSMAVKKSNKNSRTNLGKHARTSEVDREVHEIAYTWEGFSFLIERSFCWSCWTLCECLRFAG